MFGRVERKPRSRRCARLIAASGMGTFCLCAVVYAALLPKVNKKMAGIPAPAVTGASVLDGATVTIQPPVGRVLLVNFFASWCPPCNQEVDLLEKLHKSVPSDSLMIVGVAMDPIMTPATVAKVKPMVAKHRLTYPVVMATKELVDAFQCPGIPDTYVIGSDGRFVESLEGYHPMAELVHELKPLLPQEAVAKLPSGTAPSSPPAAPSKVKSMSSTETPHRVSFERNVLPILQRNCATAGCHAGGTAAAGLRLDQGAASMAALVNTPSSMQPSRSRVKLGHPEASVMWLKISGRQKAAGVPGTQMPPAKPLPVAQQRLIERWIREGASR